MIDDIYNEICRSQIVEKVTSSISSYINNDKKDFIQEMYLTIFEIPEPKLVKLYNSNQLYFYIVKIIQNQGTCMKSKFHKKYNHPEVINVEYIEKLNVADE